MLQINCSDNPAAELSQIALISNNKHTNQQAKPGTFHSMNCFSLGPLALACFSFYFLKWWMRSLRLGLQRKLLQTSSPSSPEDVAELFPNVAEWHGRAKTPPNVGRKSRGRSSVPQCLCLTVFCLALKEWDIFMPCNWMLLTLTHLQETWQSETRSNQRPSVLCLSSVGEQMQEIS